MRTFIILGGPGNINYDFLIFNEAYIIAANEKNNNRLPKSKAYVEILNMM